MTGEDTPRSHPNGRPCRRDRSDSASSLHCFSDAAPRNLQTSNLKPAIRRITVAGMMIEDPLSFSQDDPAGGGSSPVWTLWRDSRETPELTEATRTATATSPVSPVTLTHDLLVIGATLLLLLKMRAWGAAMWFDAEGDPQRGLQLARYILSGTIPTPGEDNILCSPSPRVSTSARQSASSNRLAERVWVRPEP